MTDKSINFTDLEFANGFDLSYRNTGVDWPEPWRAIVRKGTKYAPDLVVYGKTAEEALIAAKRAEDDWQSRMRGE